MHVCSVIVKACVYTMMSFCELGVFSEAGDLLGSEVVLLFCFLCFFYVCGVNVCVV